MNMQTAINIFTILGSILGIIAFLLTIFSSIHQYNFEKWKKISAILDFNDLEDFAPVLRMELYIPKNLINSEFF